MSATTDLIDYLWGNQSAPSDQEILGGGVTDPYKTYFGNDNVMLQLCYMLEQNKVTLTNDTVTVTTRIEPPKTLSTTQVKQYVHKHTPVAMPVLHIDTGTDKKWSAYSDGTKFNSRCWQSQPGITWLNSVLDAAGVEYMIAGGWDLDAYEGKQYIADLPLDTGTGSQTELTIPHYVEALRFTLTCEQPDALTILFGSPDVGGNWYNEYGLTATAGVYEIVMPPEFFDGVNGVPCAGTTLQGRVVVPNPNPLEGGSFVYNYPFAISKIEMLLYPVAWIAVDNLPIAEPINGSSKISFPYVSNAIKCRFTFEGSGTVRYFYTADTSFWRYANAGDTIEVEYCPTTMAYLQHRYANQGGLVITSMEFLCIQGNRV